MQNYSAVVTITSVRNQDVSVKARKEVVYFYYMILINRSKYLRNG